MIGMKHGFVVVGVLAVASLAYLLGRGRGVQPVVLQPSTVDAEGVDVSEWFIGSVESQEGESGKPETGRTVAGMERESAPVRCTGMLFVRDREGVHHPSDIGYISWVLYDQAGDVARVTSPIERDRWSFDPGNAVLASPEAVVWSSYTVSRIVSVDDGMIPTADLDDYTLEAAFSYSARVHVVDARTGVELNGVQLIMAQKEDDAHTQDVVPPRRLLAEGAVEIQKSPLLMPEHRGVGIGWVRAEGYAWRRFSYLGESNGVTRDLYLPLVPGAGLDISIGNLDAASYPHARLAIYQELASSGQTDGSVRAFRALALDGGRVRLSGMEPGSYTVRVLETVSVSEYVPRLAEQSIDLVSGVVRTVHLDCGDVERGGDFGELNMQFELGSDGPQARSSLEYTVELAGSSGAARGEVTVSRGRIDKLTINQGGHREKTLRGLPEGEYVVAILPLGCVGRVAVIPGQRSSILMSPQATVSLVVTLAQAGVGKNLDSGTVRIRPVGLHSTGAWREAAVDYDASEYAVSTVPGDYEVSVWLPGCERRILQVSVGSVERALHVSLMRFPTVRLRLQAEQHGSPVPLPSEFWTRITVVDDLGLGGAWVERQLNGSQVAGLPGSDSASMTVALSRPGRYRVQFPFYPGMNRPDPVLIDLDRDSEGVYSFDPIPATDSPGKERR